MSTAWFFRILVVASLVGSAGAAHANALVTYVSGRGTNTGACNTPAAACRSFAFALTKTAPGGEIRALDPAQYGAVVIDKSVSILGVPGAGITLNQASGRAITINAGATDIIHVSGLILDGFGKTALTGVELNSAGTVVIRDCIIRNFQDFGMLLQPTSTTHLTLADTLVSNNAFHGVLALPSGGSLVLNADRVIATRNGNGFRLVGAASAIVTRSNASDNISRGLLVESGAKLRLSSSTVGANSTGVEIQAGGLGESTGDNAIRGNTSADVTGTFPNIGTR